MPFPPNHWFHQIRARNAWRMTTMLSVLEQRLLPIGASELLRLVDLMEKDFDAGDLSHQEG